MDFFLSGNLTLITFFPLLGIPLVLAAAALSEGSNAPARYMALGVMVVEFTLSVPLFFNFVPGVTEMQFVVQAPWIESLGITYGLGLDGISLFLVLLTTFITPIALLSSWRSVEKHVPMFLVLMLVLESAMIGTFSALDIVLFFIFWEAVLIPMYFIIGVWGTGRRVYSAVKFFLYTAFGSALMLVAIMYLYHLHTAQFGYPSMAIADLYRLDLPFVGGIFGGMFSPQGLCFLAFLLAFVIKVPLFPFHTWLPDAHGDAPTPGSVILAAVLLKMGVYGFYRLLLPLFPEATLAFAPVLAVLSIAGIIYGAMVAFTQTDLKRLVAYSSVSHMGLIILGITVLNVQSSDGAVYQMLSHGLSTGALFILVGMIYDRRHTKMLSDLGGLAKVMPLFAAFFLLSALASIGLPLLNGFIGEFLILIGVFTTNYIYATLAALGMVLSAVYMLWAYQRAMFGNITHEANLALPDLNARELLTLLPLAVMIIFMGIYPGPFLDRIEPSVERLLRSNYAESVTGVEERRGLELTGILPERER